MSFEASVRKTIEHIRQNWDATVREPSSRKPDEVKLPLRFTCPDPQPPFRGFYYWDTYYMSVGLWLNGRGDLARNNAENMLYLLDTQGYVPNYANKQQLNRSQPLHASILMREVYEHTRDQAWLGRAFDMLEKEYAFWNSMRLSRTGLNHFHNHATPDDVYRFTGNIRKRHHPVPENPVEKMRYLMNVIAEAESGWDYTPRFDHRCMDFDPIDLNSLLYLHERNCEYFAGELGRDDDVKRWSDRAEKHRELIQHYCWDQQSGFFYDYDVPNQKRFPLKTPAGFYALWAKVATNEQAAQMVQSLPAIEREFGLTTCPHQDSVVDRPGVYQWDDPNAWAPLQHAAMVGLMNYGYVNDARRLARKWASAVSNTFEQTGHLWEKYNAYTGSLDNVTNEYPLKPMLGWTAGVFLHCCRLLEMI